MPLLFTNPLLFPLDPLPPLPPPCPTPGALSHAAGHCVFIDVKMGVLEAALASTVGSCDGLPTVYLSNFDASASAVRGAVEPDVNECIFVQAFKLLLRAVDGRAMRNTKDRGQDKVFEVR